ncbi:MAG: hypothetical protein LBF54_01015 [Holosporaceae bacterium]|nr:hypothetical protein [Holosporaceae bacterium]
MKKAVLCGCFLASLGVDGLVSFSSPDQVPVVATPLQTDAVPLPASVGRTAHRSIFFGGMREVNAEELQLGMATVLAARFGPENVEVIEFVVPSDSNGRPRRYAYLNLRTIDAIDELAIIAALLKANQNGEIDFGRASLAVSQPRTRGDVRESGMPRSRDYEGEFDVGPDQSPPPANERIPPSRRAPSPPSRRGPPPPYERDTTPAPGSGAYDVFGERRFEHVFRELDSLRRDVDRHGRILGRHGDDLEELLRPRHRRH